MSEENVELVRRMYDAFHRGAAEEALAHFAPDVVVDASTSRPDLGIGQGREHVRRVVSSWVGAWEGWREEIEEMRDLDGRVLVVSLHRGRGKGSGVEVEARWAVLYDVGEGGIARMAIFRGPEQALEAAGLSE